MLPIVVGVSGLAFQQATTTRLTFTAGAVLREAWRLYTRLWTRSLLMGGLIFGALHLLEIVVRGHRGLLVGLLTLVLTFVGTSLLQGALVEVVRGLHEDGDDDPSTLTALGRAGTKLGRLVGVLGDGRLQQLGTPEQLKAHPGNPFVAAIAGQFALMGSTSHPEKGTSWPRPP